MVVTTFSGYGDGGARVDGCNPGQSKHWTWNLVDSGMMGGWAARMGCFYTTFYT